MPSTAKPPIGGANLAPPARDAAPRATLMFAPTAPHKGRGTVWAMEHRFTRHAREALDDGWGSLDQAAQEQADALEQGLVPATQIIEEQAKSIISSNDSPDIGFDRSINPYRGCEHGCIYCYARPTHSYLGLSPGLDFETRIVAKMNAAQRLREALSVPGYKPLHINIGSVTDAYQPVERKLQLTRQVLELLSQCQHPFSIITKSSLIERDTDLIAPMAKARMAAVYVSITSLNPELARRLEPRAAAPHRRLRTIKALADAGIPVGVSVSPVIPFLNEPELEHILQAAHEAGARSAFSIVLRLPWELSPLFQSWLQEHAPGSAHRIMARIREMRGGKDYDAQFGTRMTGQGVWAQLLRQRFEKACHRLGFKRKRTEFDFSRFVPPSADGQARLF